MILTLLAACGAYITPFEYVQSGRAITPPLVGNAVDDLWAPAPTDAAPGTIGHHTAAGWATVDLPDFSASTYAADTAHLWLGGVGTGPKVLRLAPDGSVDDLSAGLPANAINAPAVVSHGDDVIASISLPTESMPQTRVLAVEGDSFTTLVDLPPPVSDGWVLAAAGPTEAYVAGLEPLGTLHTYHLKDGVLTDVPIDPGLASSSDWPHVDVAAPDDVWVWWRDAALALQVIHGDGTTWDRFSVDTWTAEYGGPVTLVALGDGEAAAIGIHPPVEYEPGVERYMATKIAADGELGEPVQFIGCNSAEGMECTRAPGAVSRLRDGTVVVLESSFGWWSGRLDGL